MEGLGVSTEAGIARITLERPAQRNALVPTLIDGLVATLDRLEADAGLRCIVLTGSGQAFCAGYDLACLTSPGTERAGAERDEVEALCTRLRAVRVPTVARVNGVASGAGCDLAVSCDVRIASEEARFAMPPARLGILYSHEGIARLAALVGPAVAKELLFTGELVNAERALAIGLVNRVCSADALDAEVERVVSAVTANAPLSIGASKRIVDAVSGGGTPAPADLAQLEEAGRQVWASEDAQEGPRAFRERRAPRFTGR